MLSVTREFTETGRSTSAVPDGSKIFSIRADKLVPNRAQPRRCFDENAIGSLADSISRYGLLQPLSVRRLPTTAEGVKYEIIAGERRYRAAMQAGMDQLPCIIINVDDRTSAELALIENIQREGLNMFEQAGAIAALIDLYGMTQEQIAAHLSASQSYVANKLRLLRLSPEERETVLSAHLSERHARALLKLRSEDEQLREAYERTVAVGAGEQEDMTQEGYVHYGTYEPFTVTLTHLLNRKSGVDFSTCAHSGLTVPVFALGAGAEVFDGFYDNTEIYAKLAALTGVA